MVQNWTAEPFIRGAYSEYLEEFVLISNLSRPLDDVVLFAGEVMPADGEYYGYAHGAALSGQKAANSILSMTIGDESTPSSDTIVLDTSIAKGGSGLYWSGGTIISTGSWLYWSGLVFIATFNFWNM